MSFPVELQRLIVNYFDNHNLVGSILFWRLEIKEVLKHRPLTNRSSVDNGVLTVEIHFHNTTVVWCRVWPFSIYITYFTTMMAARSEYDLVFYESSLPKRVSENILREKSAVRLLNLSSFQIDKGQFGRFVRF